MQEHTLVESRYARSDCKTGIVHLGFGAFHRAHQAAYIDDYMVKSGDLNWGICSINLRESESHSFASSANAIKADQGYLLQTTTPENKHHYQRIRCHTDFLDWTRDAQTSEKALSKDNINMVTITVTESGYYLTDKGELNVDDPLIQQEIAGLKACSVYAYLARALEHRATTVDKPITIFCCDNIRANGQMLKDNFLKFLSASDNQTLFDWVSRNVTFPCSMVDRITPRISTRTQNDLRLMFNTNSTAAIHSESFIQWVMENNFAGSVPDFTLAGVEIVDDVHPYEEAKIRILNGGHSGLAYLGVLAGHTTFDQTIQDPLLKQHFDNFQQREVLPALTDTLPFDKRQYLAVITSRFGNQAIADNLERICMDGYSKMQIFIRPTLLGCYEQSIVPEHTLLSVASWYVYARRIHQGKLEANYNEPQWEKMLPLFAADGESLFANSRDLWSQLPRQYKSFEPDLLAAIDKVEKTWPQ